MKNVCYVYTWPAAGLTSRASPRDVSRDTFTVGWEKKKGRTREAIETRRKTLDGWKINGPVADLFSFQHCERAVHGRSLWRATIFFFFFSFFARSSSHALHECSGHQFFLFFFFFSSTVFLAALLRGDPLPWTVDPGAPLKFLSLAIELHERRNGVKPFRPIEFYRNATFKSERQRERESEASTFKNAQRTLDSCLSLSRKKHRQVRTLSTFAVAVASPQLKWRKNASKRNEPGEQLEIAVERKKI